MSKRPDCQHQWPSEPACQPAFRNSYVCPHDGTEWTDEWSAACNDRCPTCNAEIEPLDSVYIAPCACTYLGR